MTYTGPDGKQYVAVYAGIGGDMGLLIAGDVAANLPYDVRERGTTLPDLARYTSWGGMLFVFRFELTVMASNEHTRRCSGPLHAQFPVSLQSLPADSQGCSAISRASTGTSCSRPARRRRAISPRASSSHAEHIQPGDGRARRACELKNPYEGNAAAVATGAKLFVAYNCVDCHGADGSGAMGPSLADGRWHFGGSPGEVFESIYQGRPEGMPAWGSSSPPTRCGCWSPTFGRSRWART